MRLERVLKPQCLKPLADLSNKIVMPQTSINPGLFEKRFKELDESVHSYEALQQQVKRDQRDLDERLRRYEEEREQFENERLQWKEELERKRVEMMEQNDRLTVLSEQLVGAKVCGRRKVGMGGCRPFDIFCSLPN